MRSKIASFLVSAACVAGVLASCVAANDDDAGDGNCRGTRCVPFDGSPPDEYVHDAEQHDAWEWDGSALGQCGSAGDCNPDDSQACVEFSPDGSADAQPPDTDTDGDVDAAWGDAEPGSGGEGGGGGEAGAPAPPYACQMSAGSRACGRAGTGELGSECEEQRDCAAGLSCVQLDERSAGSCRPTCCAGDDVCAAGTYCAKKPLVLGGEPTGDVPVCVPAD